MSNIVIKAENLSKYYKLGVINNGTLFRDIQTWLDLKRGKQDRHSQIGSHKYDGNAEGFWALKNLSFEIQQGDRVGIIGKNGAGKSTLLKILSRITAPTDGKVKIKGRVASLLEVGTGFHGELTGRENVYLNGAILGMKKKEVDRKIDEIIAFSEIEQHIDTPVKRYSSGMYVRLAFAVAAHLDCEILIADEVLAVGDASFQKKAIGKMDQLSKGQGKTVLFVSHQIPAVTSLCNKGIFLEKGKIIENGDLGKCVDLYFDSNINQKLPYWNKGLENEFLFLQSAGLKYNNSLQYEYKKGVIAVLELKYEIKQAGYQYVFAIDIYNCKGQLICACSASDFFSNDEYERMTSKGNHLLQLKIDTSIFGKGDYHIKFDIAIHNKVCFTIDEPILNFSVLTNEDKDSLFLSEKRCDIINPDWKWFVYE